MKICIYGAGAIGGLLGAQLALAGQDVTLIARGPHLAAIKSKGLTLRIDGAERVARPAATDEPGTAGPQDYVIITMKAHSVAPAAEAMQPLFGPETAVVTAMNGIPWWYFHALPGPFLNHQLKSIDPEGILWRRISPTRCIGCVVYPAAEIVAPGVVQHQYGNRFMLGEPDGSHSARAVRLSEALTKAGFKSLIRPKIRDDIGLKLWGNLSFNPVSALTHATLATIAGDPATRDLVRRMMVEAQQVATHLGIKFDIDLETRIGWAADVGDHRTSMLQDLQLGRPMEIDALVTAVAEMGD
ncbi:MAG: 2-dehydropantoate 2-reductase, partial [Dongiaceae bacterium]